jgi:hypothetical protein
MNDDQFTPEELALIQHLQEAPKQRLNPAVSESIRQQVLEEFRATARTIPPKTSPIKQYPQAVKLLGAIAASLAIVIAAFLLLKWNNTQDKPEATPFALALSPTPSATPINTPTPTLLISPPVIESETPPTEPEISATPLPTESILTITLPVTETIPPATSPVVVTPTETSLPVVIVEGPVQSIVNNFITIYNLTIVVEPQHPILTLIDVGDVVLVEGNFDANGMVMATLVSNIATSTTIAGTAASVGLDGPVESINGNLVMVNGITVQFDRADPILASLQVGQFISVQGNFTTSGSLIVLLVVNVTVITNINIQVNPQCWYHEPGMGMGHWHCDGMGMGMGMGR